MRAVEAPGSTRSPQQGAGMTAGELPSVMQPADDANPPRPS
jgi:hypothetical protein